MVTSSSFHSHSQRS